MICGYPYFRKHLYVILLMVQKSQTTTWDGAKTLQNNGIKYKKPQLVGRISETSTVPKKHPKRNRHRSGENRPILGKKKVGSRRFCRIVFQLSSIFSNKLAVRFREANIPSYQIIIYFYGVLWNNKTPAHPGKMPVNFRLADPRSLPTWMSGRMKS